MIFAKLNAKGDTIRIFGGVILAVVLIATSLSCDTSNDPTSGETLDGYVVLVNFGCWYFSNSSSASETTQLVYELRGLPSEFRQDGLAVRITVVPADLDVGTACGFGPLVDVVSIAER